MGRLAFVFVLILSAVVAAGPRPSFEPQSVANAAPGDETFTTFAGATAHSWSGTPLILGTTGGTLPVAISAVFNWVNANQSFRFWFRGFPLNFNTLTTLETDAFYFFQGPANEVVTIEGSAGHQLPIAPPTISTSVGATGVLWLGGPLAPEALPLGVSAVFRWKDETQSFQFWFRGFPVNFNTLAGDLTLGEFFFLQSGSATPITVPPLGGGLTSAELIDAAVAAHTLSALQGATVAETALVYKLFADFGDSRLPQLYKGARAQGGEPESLEGIKQLLGTLSSTALGLVSPFLLPPAADGSWFEARANAGTTVGTGTRAVTWDSVSSEAIKVWWQTVRPTDAPIAAALLSEMEDSIWPTLVNLMGTAFAPPSDLGFNDTTVNGDGGDGKFDIYLVGNTADFGVADTLAFSRAYSLPPCPAGGPSFMVLGEHSSFSILKSTAAHEFMHAIQKAYFQCADAYKWVGEATATWAESFVYPDVDDEHGRLPSFFTRMANGHTIDSLEGTHEYGAYLWFYFLTQAQNDLEIIPGIYADAPNPAPHTVIEGVVDGPMQERWHQFALATLNVGPVDQFADWDGIVDSSLAPPTALGSDDLVFEAVQVSSMGFQTKLVTIESNRPAGTDIKVSHPMPSAPATVRFQVMLKRNGTWQPPVTVASQTTTFCADSSANRIEQVAMVLSNAEYTNMNRIENGHWSVEIATSPCAMLFTFANDGEGWSNGVVSNGSPFNKSGRVQLQGNGVMRLDGTDPGGPDLLPNGWIFRTITIPPNATTLSFDSAAHNQPGSDSALRVRLVLNNVSTTLLDWSIQTGGGGDVFIFQSFSADISAFAGQSVTIFLEQSDGGVMSGAHEQRYLDNIAIY